MSKSHLPTSSFLFALLFVLAGFLPACRTAVLPPQVQLTETSLPVASPIPVDSLAEATITPYRQQVEEKMEEVIGEATFALEKGLGESALGNFVADLMFTQAAVRLADSPDLAVTNIGGLRVPISAGPVKVGQIFELMPFENELIVLTLPGSTVEKLFAYAATRRDAAIANATYTIRAGKPENIRIKGQAFDPTKNYRVVTTDYLYNGGDQMFFMKEALRVEQPGITLRDAIINHIRFLTAQNQPVQSQVEGRVKEM